MRRRVSDRKRMLIILSSIVLLVAAVIFIMLKGNLLTRTSLNNDRISANVSCVEASVLSSDEVTAIIKSGMYMDNTIDEEMLKTIEAKDGEICSVKLEYAIGNGESSEISNLSVKILTDDKALGKIYCYSPLEFVSDEDGVGKYYQMVLLDEVDVNYSFFEKELPMDFKGPFKYVLSYDMKGQYGTKTIVFSTVER